MQGVGQETSSTYAAGTWSLKTDDGADEAFNQLLDDENQWPQALYMTFPSSAPPLFPLSSRASPIDARLSPDNLFSSAEPWSLRDLSSPLPFAKVELSVHGQLKIPR